MLHGMMTIPPVGNEPLAIPAREVLVVMIDEPARPPDAEDRGIERVEVQLRAPSPRGAPARRSG